MLQDFFFLSRPHLGDVAAGSDRNAAGSESLPSGGLPASAGGPVTSYAESSAVICRSLKAWERVVASNSQRGD